MQNNCEHCGHKLPDIEKVTDWIWIPGYDYRGICIPGRRVTEDGKKYEETCKKYNIEGCDGRTIMVLKN